MILCQKSEKIIQCHCDSTVRNETFFILAKHQHLYTVYLKRQWVMVNSTDEETKTHKESKT